MDRAFFDQVLKSISQLTQEEIRIMEVCGSHSQAISKLGLRTLLPQELKLLSGPGCPVCVTSEDFIDRAIEIQRKYGCTLLTFGDLIRVKGTKSTLLEEKSLGGDIRIIYSPLDALDLAEKNKEKNFIFLAVGFETTAPTIALAIKNARKKSLNNLFFLTALKLMPPVIHQVLKSSEQGLSGIIAPGHVATVMGSDYFRFIAEDYNIPTAVCGFEALDLTAGIYYLVNSISKGDRNAFENLYKRAVRPQGNQRSKAMLQEVFTAAADSWRGIGLIKDSALSISNDYEDYDAAKAFPVSLRNKPAPSPCRCGDILMGRKSPRECKSFMVSCTPLNPLGPCMISSEGACAIAYKYKEEQYYGR